MAKTASITGDGLSAQVFIDGHEVTDLISYKLEGSRGRCTMTVALEIMESITAEIDATPITADAASASPKEEVSE